MHLALRAGTTVTRDEILTRLRERIVAFVASRMMREVAEDLAQETLVLLHEKYREVDRLEELVPLALQIVRFKMAGWRRKAIRRGEPDHVSIDDVPIADPHESPAAYAERRELLDRLSRALSRVDGRCRQLVRLKLEGRSFPEIQTILKVDSINTVYTWDLRCRKRLLELMGGSWERRK